MNHLHKLTKSEQRIWEMLGEEGLTDTQIADRLSKSPATIRCQMRQLTAKLGVPSRTQAIIKWWQVKL